MALTTYTKTAWANGTSPAINATNLGKIEDRLYDLTEEAITPTSLTTTTATQEITSLPSTALKSRLDVTLQGNTYVNVVKNGNFANGTTNWSALPSSSLSATNNTLTITGIGSYTSSTCYQLHNIDLIKQNDKIYIKSYARVTNADCTALSMYVYDGSLSYTTTQTLPTQDTWYSLSIIGNITTAIPTSFRTYLRHNYVDIATQNGKVMEVQNVMTINLTNLFGAGNEPTLEEADLMFENWFDDVESTGKQIVKTVGKNLIRNGNAEEGLLYGRATTYDNVASPTKATTNGNGFEITSTASGYGFESWFIPIEKNKSYTFQANFTTITGSPNYRILILCYDSNKNILNADGLLSGSGLSFTSAYQGYISGSQTVDGVLSKNFQITSDAVKYIKCKALNYSYPTIVKSLIQNMQLEQGTTATTYEKYTETTAIIPSELKQVSDSIRDTFDANLGVHTNYISDWVDLSGNAFTWLFSADNIGNKRIQTSEFLSNKGALNTSLFIKYNLEKLEYDASGTIGNTFIDYANGRVALTILDTDSGWDETWVSGTSFTGMTWTNLIKAYMNGWKLTTANTNVASCVWTGIASGTTQSGSGGYTHVTTTIDTGYTPYQMIYQLATPIVTNYYPNVLTAEPSGTVYVYPFIADYDFYDSGCGVSDTTYPINFLEYVNVVDKDTGALSPVDISTCTVATGGLSFTSTALSASDLVDFGYTYKELSTIPTIEYSYPTNLKATVDGNTNNIRDLDKKQEQTTTALNLKTDEIARDLKILKLMGGI